MTLCKEVEMKQFIFIASILIASVTSTSVAVSATKQYMKLSDGVERYVEFTAPKEGKPWIVFTNGLVYEVNRFAALDANLKRQGYGIVHYYFRGQDLTLRREVETYKTPSFMTTGLTQNDFTQELKEIIQQLQIKDKIVLVGLSYGAHAAANFAQTYPRKIEQLIFMAPLVVPLEKYQPQGAWLDWNLAWVKALWGSRFYELAYRQIYATYLNSRVTADRVPASLADMPNQYRESLFHLVRVARDFDLKRYNFSTLPKNSVHFMVAKEDVPAAFYDQTAAFERVDAKSQGSLFWLPEAQHAIPDDQPLVAAKTLHAILQKDPRLQQGKKYKNTSQGLTTL
jgi:pimeloyl-ACP methyl ester carboxylesterase